MIRRTSLLAAAAAFAAVAISSPDLAHAPFPAIVDGKAKGVAIDVRLAHFDFKVVPRLNEERRLQGKIIFTPKIQELLWRYTVTCKLRWPERNVRGSAELSVSTTSGPSFDVGAFAT